MTGGTASPRAHRTALEKARYRRILRFSIRWLVQTWWYEIFLPRLHLGRVAERTRPARMRRFARSFHALALDLGGLMIKVGQYMSSRLDVLPPEITAELQGLQDQVPAVDFEEIRTLAEAQLGMPLDRAFASVDPVPIAAASLGQTHRARLLPEDAAEAGFSTAVLKVQRPGISAIVDVDLAALRRVGGWLTRIRLVSDRVDAPALVEEFAVTSLEEVDYRAEAAHVRRFAELFADDPRVAAPAVVPSRSAGQVLTLADVTAIKVTDLEALRAAGIDPAEVAEVFAEVMFDQLFHHGYFHADPHPGNIFVTPRAASGDGIPAGGAPGDGVSGDSGLGDGGLRGDVPAGDDAVSSGRPWTLTFIDFGMMGEVTPTLRAGLRALLIAVASRNSRSVVQAISEMGVLLPSADTVELERAMTALFSRFGGMGFAELREVDPREFQRFGMEFRDVVRALPFQLPENFLLIVRATSLTSGMCSSIDPQFNLWNSVEPYAQQLLRDERGTAVRGFARDLVQTAGTLARLPDRVDSFLSRVDEGRLVIDSTRVESRLGRVEQTGRRVVSAILFAAFLLGGILLREDHPTLSTILLCASAPALAHALFAGWFRSR